MAVKELAAFAQSLSVSLPAGLQRQGLRGIRGFSAPGAFSTCLVTKTVLQCSLCLFILLTQQTVFILFRLLALRARFFWEGYFNFHVRSVLGVPKRETLCGGGRGGGRPGSSDGLGIRSK